MTKKVVFSVAANSSSGNSSDITAPGSVTNLTLTGSTTSSLSWSWINPTDSDFAYAIVYIDGVNVLNTSANSYSATGLGASTTHTITLNTADVNGNVNFTNVSNTATTQANGNNDDHHGGHSDGGNGGRNVLNNTEIPEEKANIHLGDYNESDNEYVQPNFKLSSQNGNGLSWLIWLLIIASIILIIALIAMVVSKQK